MTLHLAPFRRSFVLTIVLLLLSLVAVSAVPAGKPDRFVLGPIDPFVNPAGFGCSFATLVTPAADVSRTITTFDNGRQMINVHGHATYSNLDSGATFDHHPVFQGVDTYDPVTNEINSVTHGRFTVTFYPGDMGPEGVVGESGAILMFIGSVKIKIDAGTFVYTDFSYAGSYIDVCALIG